MMNDILEMLVMVANGEKANGAFQSSNHFEEEVINQLNRQGLVNKYEFLNG